MKSSTDTNTLKFENFKNTIWVDGKTGPNGELPDTIIFVKKDSLLFIGQEPSTRETCPYYFEGDSLTFTSHDTLDYDLSTWIYVQRFQFRNKKFKEVYTDYKSSNDKNWLRTSPAEHEFLRIEASR